MRYRYSCALTLILAACGSVQAFSNGPPAQRSGVPGEANGATCTACHLGTPLNSDTRGKLTIEAGDYKPGVKQTIRLILEHPEARIARFAEEHGFLDLTRSNTRPNVGDVVRIVPNHVCVVVNMMDEVVMVRGEEIIGTLSVAARGKLR